MTTGMETVEPATKVVKVKKAKKEKSADGKVTKASKRKAEQPDVVVDPELADVKPKKKKKADAAPALPAESNSSDISETVAVPEPVAADPMSLDNFRLSNALKSMLRAKNIDGLFPIQAQTLASVLDGFDMVGRARTGQGKTLAFVLPIVEKLGELEPSRAHGRAPRVCVLAPTRELAKQVLFSALKFSSVSVLILVAIKL